MSIHYLEDFDNYPKEYRNTKKTIKFIQKPSTKDEYEKHFTINDELDDIWNDIYVYVYKDSNPNVNALIIKPFEIIYHDTKKRLFKRDREITSNLPGAIRTNTPIILPKSEKNNIKNQFIQFITKHGMPWSYGRINAIHRQNQLNYALKMFSSDLKKLTNDKIETYKLKDIFNNIYKFQ